MTINNINKIRNFSIIAHIDHGKSTLADRMLEITGTFAKRDMKDRLLDTLELEQEKGITIKLQTSRMKFKYSGEKEEYKDQEFILNLIDTPGHVDFSYEVSRSLAASEGAVILVDATQGIQAQTISTVYKALENNLELIPVINKIDLPSSEPERVMQEMADTFGFDPDQILKTSGKTGEGVIELLNRIIESVPAPSQGDDQGPKALVFDSFYDEHKGVVALIRMMNGNIKNRDMIHFIQSGTTIEPIEIGYLYPFLGKENEVHVGEVGYIATGLKDIKKVHVGDTVTTAIFKDKVNSLSGYQKPKSMVFASLYPVESDEFTAFSEALEKLALNDASLTFQKESSQALGSGYLCGFLGLLHLEITIERLTREFDINLISTTPSVEYIVHLTTDDTSKLPNVNVANINGRTLRVMTAAEFPDPTLVEYVEEPWVKVEIITPDEYIGGIMDLANTNRGVFKDMQFLTDNIINGKKHVVIKYEMPTAEIITNFFDKMKSISQGYASLDYEHFEYRRSDTVNVSILINEDLVEPLSFLSHRASAEFRGRELVSKLKEIIPKQNFKVPIQAAIGGKIIARETIQAYRKDVTAKLYGGDITRKKKLLEKQKRGKKKLKTFGKIEIPKEAFLAALKN